MRFFTSICLQLISGNSLDLKFNSEFLSVKCDLSSKKTVNSLSVFPSFAQKDENIFFNIMLEVQFLKL